MVIGAYAVYRHYLAPTRILVVNALKAQQADITLNNDSRHIQVECVEAEEMGSLEDYDAIIVYARRIFLTDEQMAEVKRVAEKGVPIFTKTLRTSDFVENHNLDEQQIATLQQYFDNENRQNFRNGLRYLRHLATPHRWGDQTFDKPVEVPSNMFYHRQYGQYFKSSDELTTYLKANGLYHPDGPCIALISGITFPMEGNRQHVDTLITLLTQQGMNVYPLTGMGKKREKLLQALEPDAVVYLPMGRIGNDTLVQWMQEKNIALFCPFPVSVSHDEWMNESIPMSSGSKNARIVIPEIDGGMAPYCIGTQNPDPQGYQMYTAETERCKAFAEHVARYLLLRTKPNHEKRIAIGYFRRPGNDALLASGMEVIPSMYNLLQRFRNEGYDVSGLPQTLDAFARTIHQAADHPMTVDIEEYNRWISEMIPSSKLAEVNAVYGAAVTDIPIIATRYGNILLFLQPRPVLGDDDFRFEHGAKVPPPHNYLATYLYMQRGFLADALIHFGTHGNLEFTPGRDAGMRPEDWSAQLIGTTPHFYYYTTANIGEAIIAKRRSHAVILTYLTAPYAESGLKKKYAVLHDNIHKAVASGQTTIALKRAIIDEGIHRALGLDSIPTTPYTLEQLEHIESHLDELMNEKMQGAYYTLGQPYTSEQLLQTAKAMNSDPVSWSRISTQLLASTKAEIDNMVRALCGGTIAPAPGGDPVLNDNVLPTGRNMFSINPENTPDEQAWEDGVRLAETTIQQYRQQHGDYPRKVSYTLWAGEFIATGGATIAQVLWMLGVEPERDSQGRILSLRLVPSCELKRPRIDVVVQVSGQLRDIADSRLKLITEAIQLAAKDKGDDCNYKNYVSEGTLEQKQQLLSRGVAPERADELSTLRVFGPLNNGYSTGMMNLIEQGEKWNGQEEIVRQYLNNMGAAYGDEQHWGAFEPGLFAFALNQTDIVVQPRQSNTWGPLSLDHVYEFTGGVSLVVKTLTGKEPEALMADYRNPRNRRMQNLREAIDIEARTTLLNPTYIRERMKGDEGTAHMFGEMFRNIFGWSTTRPSALDSQLYDQLHRLYVEDEEHLGIREFFQQKNPAAYQSMTDVLLEGARKGFWHPSANQMGELVNMRDHLVRQQESGPMIQGDGSFVTSRDVTKEPSPCITNSYPFVFFGVAALFLIIILLLIMYLKR
jgi:cobaltochelatase CobN